MSLPEDKRLTLEQFYRLRENRDEILEYVDGVVYMSPSPSTKHQRISGRLHAQLFNLLDGGNCEVFHAPFDIELKSKEVEGKKIVIPDLSVICEKEGLEESKYVGVPTLIIEIISPSNQAHDLVFKLNLYMQYGVKEYWIVNPIINTIQVYTLVDGEYRQKDVAKEKGMIESAILPKFRVDLERVFS
ncbi:Uma2 family endonuclease [Mesobacillus foraminis]|uniref:Uma2 family endonuclease n=1 Tax=Mesobacillus foraminis TaxID=279826 RepID=UPI001BE83192|nr:Uma2 family endonuclease [Mesobacillus foraminis]MBT2757969.1 Uma2 family endonuclease [Mesobacillus foraminis]